MSRYMGQIMAECDCQHQACEMRSYCMAARIRELEAQVEAATVEAVAAEREALAAGIEAKIGQHVHSQSLTTLALRDIADAIRARTPADAQAALEARDRRKKSEALREASIFDLIEEMKRRHNPPRTGLEKVDLSRADDSGEV